MKAAEAKGTSLELIAGVEGHHARARAAGFRRASTWDAGSPATHGKWTGAGKRELLEERRDRWRSGPAELRSRGRDATRAEARAAQAQDELDALDD